MKKESKYYFDENAANSAVKFIETYVKHVDAEWMGQPLILEDWQKTLLRDIFGWKHKDSGLRKYRVVYVEVPRKNGKSTLAACVALIMMYLENENAAQMYCAAAAEKQANIVFKMAERMIKSNDFLLKKVETYARAINWGTSFFKPTTKETASAHGLSANLCLIDELHAHKSGDLLDTLMTSMGSRRQPLTFIITTAGFDITSVCYEYHEEALNIIAGVTKNDSFLPVVYAADPTDDIYDEETWKKANPNYGISLKPEYMREKADEARRSTAKESVFKRLHLNIWTSTPTTWIHDHVWEAGGTDFEPKILKGAICYGGLDLSSNSDITALSLVFPIIEDNELVKFYSLNWFWLPEEKGQASADDKNRQYIDWVKGKHIIETPGNVVDYDFVREQINEISTMYKVQQIAYDPYRSVDIAAKLTGDGIEMVEHRQGFVSMGNPTAEFEKYILSGKFDHGNDPVLRWMVANVVIQEDAAGNMKVIKNHRKRRLKVDGVITNIMGISGYIANEIGNDGKSYLETEDLVIIPRG